MDKSKEINLNDLFYNDKSAANKYKISKNKKSESSKSSNNQSKPSNEQSSSSNKQSNLSKSSNYSSSKAKNRLNNNFAHSKAKKSKQLDRNRKPSYSNIRTNTSIVNKLKAYQIVDGDKSRSDLLGKMIKICKPVLINSSAKKAKYHKAIKLIKISRELRK